MTNTQKMNQYINTPVPTFNRCALALYLDNLRKKLFPDPELLLSMLRATDELMGQYQSQLFSFIAAFEERVGVGRFTAAQNAFLYRHIINLITESARAASLPASNMYSDYYLPYFTTLHEIATDESQAEIIVQGKVKEQVHHTIQHELLALADELEHQTLEKRTKTLGTLLRVTTQYERLTRPKPARVARTVAPPGKTLPNEIALQGRTAEQHAIANDAIEGDKRMRA